MICDCFTYNGEKDLFDIRYNILKDYVDRFVVIEFDKTFSGKDKPFYFDEIMGNYDDSVPIHYHAVKDNVWHKYMDLAKNSPNTQGADHWKEEFCQKEYIKDCLTDLQDDDIVFIGDCDEIWNHKILEFSTFIKPVKLGLLVYTYYLNNRSSEIFKGTLVGLYKDIKNKCLNHLRTDTYEVLLPSIGWHFTSLIDGLRRKLTDSYTNETYANEWVMDNLDFHIQSNVDFLGREFTFKVDESEWPEYLKINRESYRHLLK